MLGQSRVDSAGQDRTGQVSAGLVKGGQYM